MATFTFTAEKSDEDQHNGGGSALTPGYYRARILKCCQTTSNSGNPMLVAELDALTPTGVSACRLMHYMPVSVTWKLEQFAAAIGLKFRPGQPVSFDPNTLAGTYIIVRTCMEPDRDSGKLYTRADAVLAPGKEPHLGAMDESELFAVGLNPDGTRPRKGTAKTAPPRQQQAQARGGRYDQRATATTSTQGRYVNPQSQAAIDAAGDDDIPF